MSFRVRHKDGELRIYLQTEENYKTLDRKLVVKALMKRKKGWEYMRIARKQGLWVCINSINTKRYKIEPNEIIS